MLKTAFKEWAVICKALAEGTQALILRKGGIAEEAGEFRVEHNRFWMYPTYVHQQETGIQEEYRPLLQQAQAEQPPTGTVRLTHWAEVEGIYHVKQAGPAQLLTHLHIWSDETVDKRFHYRQPGLYVLVVRVYRRGEVLEVVETPEYAGCKSWVALEQDFPTEGSTPVLDATRIADVTHQLELLLNPTAFA